MFHTSVYQLLSLSVHSANYCEVWYHLQSIHFKMHWDMIVYSFHSQAFILPCLVSLYYLNQCWLIVNWILWNKLQLNLNHITKFFIHKNGFRNVVHKIAAILSKERWVNGWNMQLSYVCPIRQSCQHAAHLAILDWIMVVCGIPLLSMALYPWLIPGLLCRQLAGINPLTQGSWDVFQYKDGVIPV